MFKRFLEYIQKGAEKGLTYLLYDAITPEDKRWATIRQLQEIGKLPPFLRQVYVYHKPRQYERGVKEMENFIILKVVLRMPQNILAISPAYEEKVKHNTFYNPHEGRLHVLLSEYESLEDLLQKESIFKL